MNKTFYITFIFFGFFLHFSTLYGQRKIVVKDDLSSFPIHDVNVIVFGMNVIKDGEQWKKTETIEDLIELEQYFTNKKGKIQTSLLEIADYSWKISFHHENYFSKTISFDSLVNLDFEVTLSSNANSLEETVVSASRIAEKKKDVIQKIRVIQSLEIQNQNQSSMADLIDNSGNVFVQKSQLGGGSPIIRGFETNKVLMVVDGVRMNNAIYRGGHLQNIITLDNSIMDRVEVVFGPGSVIYGSDAIGGVMTFKTKDPVLSRKDKVMVIGDAYTRYFSAANGFSSNAHVSVGNKKIGSLTSFTYSKFGDLRQGSKRSDITKGFGERNWYVSSLNGMDTMLNNSNPNMQIGSGYEQYDMLQKFIYKPNEFVLHKVNLQLSNSGNVDRYDRLTQLENGQAKYAQWYYGPQFRFLSSYSLELSKSNKFFDFSKFVLAYQSIEESRMVRKFRDVELKSRNESLDIITFNFDFSKLLPYTRRNGKILTHELRYGVDIFYNDVKSNAFSTNIINLQESLLDSRYPDGGSDMFSFAVYITDNIEFNDKMIFNIGIRSSQVRLNADFIDKTFFPFPFSSIKQRNSSINGNMGLIFMPNDLVRYTISAATGFRAPNVDDVSKVFESVPGKVIVPNPQLKPEYSYNLEFGSEIKLSDKIRFSTNLFGTFLTNALTVQNANLDGQDSVLYDGTYSQVITTTNANRAFVCGIEGVLSGSIGKSWNIYSTINYTYGRILTDSVPYPLDHIPPLFGKVSVKYQWKKIATEFFVNYSGWKRLKDYNLVGEDNYAFALEEGMPSWYTLNLRIHFGFSKNISFQFACENILDQNYRKFASNISSPGRNFILTLRGRF
ncbi:MAG: TonB-dependent receptor [Flavobacteriales bacterium]|nr:TonB-dependent receptor [Flavobacteriales bacterium]